MTTAAEIIKGALRRLQILGSEADIESAEIADGLEDLNDWASALESGKVRLGFTRVANSGDTINIPAEAVGMYKDNLAVYIAGQYGAPIQQSLILSAENSMVSVLNAFAPVILVKFPDTLPIGSGNECDLDYQDQRFFEQNESDNF